jgi:hypothetical protein
MEKGCCFDDAGPCATNSDTPCGGEVLLIDEFEVRKVAHVPYRLVRNKLSALDDAHQNFAKPQMNN